MVGPLPSEPLPIVNTTVCEDLPVVSTEARHRIAAAPPQAAVHGRYLRSLGLFDRVEVRQAPARRPVGETLRVAFWNIERCKYLQEAADLLAAVKPDIVLLAEMDNGMA